MFAKQNEISKICSLKQLTFKNLNKMFLYESKIKQIVHNNTLNLNQNSEVAEFA